MAFGKENSGGKGFMKKNKIISWNVNGLRAALRKGLLDFIRKEKADVYCFQEVKLSSRDLDSLLPFLPVKGYETFYHIGKKNGYSGVAISSKIKPVSVIEGIGKKEFDDEGRVLTLEFEKFFLVNAYFPNSRRELARLDFKLKFNKLFSSFCKKLEKKKPVVITGDFNVAHQEIDIKNPKQNEKNAGFTIEERNWFEKFLDKGYVDTFREFVKEGGHYTWWTHRFNAREKNVGWRIDYFLISKKLRKSLINSSILKNVMGSDHCPVRLEIND